MSLRGSAALAFEVEPLDAQRTRIVVAGYFHPASVRALLHWHALTPAHALIFPGLARAIAQRAQSRPREPG